jgi:hypothetical protein
MSAVCFFPGKWLLPGYIVKADHCMLIMTFTGKAGVVTFGSRQFLSRPGNQLTWLRLAVHILRLPRRNNGRAPFGPRQLLFKSVLIQNTVGGVQSLTKCFKNWLNWKIVLKNTHLNCVTVYWQLTSHCNSVLATDVTPLKYTFSSSSISTATLVGFGLLNYR